MDLNELFELLWSLLQGANQWMKTGEWASNALLDLFLHAMWSGAAALVGLWLAYWAARLLYFVLAPRLGSDQEQWGLGFVLTRRVVGLCILGQFAVDILGHAYAVFRQDLPVTLANLGQRSARDFHGEAWCLSAIICLVLGVYLVIRLKDGLRSQGEGLPARLEGAMRRFSYSIALFASLCAHMWWDRLLSFG